MQLKSQLEKIEEIQAEMARTQKNKATECVAEETGLIKFVTEVSDFFWQIPSGSPQGETSETKSNQMGVH